MSQESKYSSPYPAEPFSTREGQEDDTFRIDPNFELIKGVKVENMTDEQVDQYLQQRFQQWIEIYGIEEGTIYGYPPGEAKGEWVHKETWVNNMRNDIVEKLKGPMDTETRIELLNFFLGHDMTAVRTLSVLGELGSKIVKNSGKVGELIVGRDPDDFTLLARRMASEGIAVFHLKQKLEHEKNVKQALGTQ